MKPTNTGLNRRTVLGVGGLGTAGCIEGEESNEDIERPVTTATGGVGGATTPTQRAAVEPPAESGRIGHTVYYDTNNRGSYADLQQALSDVPDGGTLWLGLGDIDVATEGRLSLSRAVHIQGAGWESNTPGTRLVNRGEEAIDEPVLEYVGADEVGEEFKNIRVRDVGIWHSGDSPAVRFRNVAKSLLRGCNVGCWGGGSTGVKYEGEAYLARCFENKIGGFTDYGVYIESKTDTRPAGGYGHEFFHNVAATGNEDATALRTERPRTIVVGGEYMARGGTGTAIEFFNPISEAVEGGLVLEPGIERTPNSIVIDGESPFDNVQLYHTFIPAPKPENGTGIRFGNARDCKLVNPIVPRDHSGRHLAHWSMESEHCSIVTCPETLSRVTYTNDGATHPNVHVVGTTPDATIRDYPTGVPTTVTYNPDRNGPVFHDGDEWREIPSSTFSP